MTLHREVQPVPPPRAQLVVLAVIGLVAILLAAQQCAEHPSRLAASVRRDPIPE